VAVRELSFYQKRQLGTSEMNIKKMRWKTSAAVLAATIIATGSNASTWDSFHTYIQARITDVLTQNWSQSLVGGSNYIINGTVSYDARWQHADDFDGLRVKYDNNNDYILVSLTHTFTNNWSESFTNTDGITSDNYAAADLYVAGRGGYNDRYFERI